MPNEPQVDLTVWYILIHLACSSFFFFNIVFANFYMKLSRIFGRFGLSANYFFNIELKDVYVFHYFKQYNTMSNCSIHLLNLTIAFEGLSIDILPL